MTRGIARPEKESYVLVEFRYGEDASSVARYTDLEQEASGFTSVPLLQVEIPDNVGTFQENEARVVMPVMDAFTTRLSDGLSHSPVYVRIEEQIRGLAAGDAGTNLVHFRGRADDVVRNYQRRAGMMAVTVLSAKSRLRVPLGLQMNHHDEARLFGPMSGLLQASFEEPGEIDSVDGREVTIFANPNIEDPFAPGGTNDRFWERGWLEKDGLRIQVHIWNKNDDPKVFVLRERPPGDWVQAGANSILFVPGTHGTIEDARDVWDDEEHFLGLGYASPSWNPLIESPLPLDSA